MIGVFRLALRHDVSQPEITFIYLQQKDKRTYGMLRAVQKKWLAHLLMEACKNVMLKVSIFCQGNTIHRYNIIVDMSTDS